MGKAPTIIRGTNDKPAASEALATHFSSVDDPEGFLFIGYPVIGTPSGTGSAIDAVYVTPRLGIVVFDLVEGRTLGDWTERQDDAATKLTSRLLGHKELVSRRKLRIEVSALTYAPGTRSTSSDEDYPVANSSTLDFELAKLSWPEADAEVCRQALSVLQTISAIRRPRAARQPLKLGSRGAKLRHLEAAIATLDAVQGQAVIETVEGVQRIRGLAGSGKTIVLALKAAYLHAQHPDWRIAVTFNTRSLKGYFRRLINNFCIEQSGEEPDWDMLRVLNAWGAQGGGDREGVYHEFCTTNGVPYLDFQSAQAVYGREEGFARACAVAVHEVKEPTSVYDVILVDEAQDLSPEFLRLCYSMLRPPHRLVFAYDELQNLSGAGLPPIAAIFGTNKHGRPKVPMEEPDPAKPRRDVILEKCYRNSRPVLVTAHALGFGIYRKSPRSDRPDLAQMFGDAQLWTEIGYRVRAGTLTPGSEVVLGRTSETSPKFLEDHSPIDDLISFQCFGDEGEQTAWIADQIMCNLAEDELRHDDIIVVHTEPVTTRRRLGPIREALLAQGVQSHLAGVDTISDVFFKPDVQSITFSGIFRAKGNEAAMVYVVNAQDCQSQGANLARLRNRLFTAMTRSKAWVRVTGFGPQMEELIDEYKQIRGHDFELDFIYPDATQLAQLQIVHRDMSAAELKAVQNRKSAISEVVSDLEAGRLFLDDLDEDTVHRLRSLLDSDE